MTKHDHNFRKGVTCVTTLPALQNVAIKATAPTKVKEALSVESTWGTWFDPSLDLRNPEGERITATAQLRIQAIETRQRKLKQVDAQNRNALIRAILANGFRCLFYREPQWVSYSRRGASYKDGPDWLNGRAIGAAIDLLAKAGMIESVTGERGRASTYRVVPELYDIAHDCGLTEHSLTLCLPRERLVRLREGNAGTIELPVTPTDEVCLWTEQIEGFNAFIRRQDITLALTAQEEAEWVKHWNDKRGGWKGGDCPILSSPELFQTDLYRQFNNGSLDQGGRLYGGWWINMPGKLRRRISINGQPTVELDYSGCQIRMLYHQRGIDYQGDPYRLEELTACEDASGLQSGHFREGVKSLFQALINGDPDGMPHLANIKDFTFKPYFKRVQVREMLERMHAPIADSFATGEGLRLQRVDSDLALSIITRLCDQGIVSLPVHDSFIVRETDQGALFDVMQDEYLNRFQKAPCIKSHNQS